MTKPQASPVAWVRLKSSKELLKLGYTISHVSDDGEFMRFGKGGTELGLWSSAQHEPQMVVNCGVIHENAVKMFPDAFEVCPEGTTIE